jgi:hypothetical protein
VPAWDPLPLSGIIAPELVVDPVLVLHDPVSGVVLPLLVVPDPLIFVVPIPVRVPLLVDPEFVDPELVWDPLPEATEPDEVWLWVWVCIGPDTIVAVIVWRRATLLSPR